MQKIISKQNGRYKLSFAHWNKTQRNLLAMLLLCGILYLGWWAWKDQPMPHLFKILIWDNMHFIFPAFILLYIVIRHKASQTKQEKSAKP